MHEVVGSSPAVMHMIKFCFFTYLQVHTGIYTVRHSAYLSKIFQTRNKRVCTLYSRVYYSMFQGQLCYGTRSWHTVQDPPNTPYFRYVPGITTGHDPSEFSFLEIRVICTWSWLVCTQILSVHTTLISKKPNSLGLWPVVIPGYIPKIWCIWGVLYYLTWSCTIA